MIGGTCARQILITLRCGLVFEVRDSPTNEESAEEGERRGAPMGRAEQLTFWNRYR